MRYSLIDAVKFITRNHRIELTDDELRALIVASGEAIEAKGRAVREASQAYEQYVVELAAAIRAPKPHPILSLIPKRAS